MNYVILLIVIEFVVFTYTFRFQRTTLSISRSLVGDSSIQTMLTPVWVGILGWMNVPLMVLAIIAIGLSYSWVLAIMYFIALHLVHSTVDTFTPIPSYKHCFSIIKKHLSKSSDLGRVNKKNVRTTLEADKLLSEVKNIEKQYLSGKVKIG